MSPWILFALTFATMTYAGMLHADGFAIESLGVAHAPWSMASVFSGMGYSVPLMAMLAAHEGGHVAMCRRWGVKTTGPYFMPIGLALTGTFGAFLRLKSEYPTRSAMLAIAASGPLAGMVLVVPFAVLGIALSLSFADPHGMAFMRFGDPLFFRPVLDWMGFADAKHVIWHPVALAAWIGAVATFVNLIPYGSFDGGLIVAALWGPEIARDVSFVAFGLAVIGAVMSMTAFLVVAVMVLSGWQTPTPVDVSPVAHRWAWTAAMALVWLSVWTVV